MDTLKEILILIVPTISGGIGGFFFGRGKYKAEVEGIRAHNDTEMINNAKSIIEIYKKELDEIQERNHQKFLDFTKLSDQKIELLQQEININKRIITSLKKENTGLRKRVRELEKSAK